ncbi:MAG: leucine--tRNA ligase, partial [Candidatus Aerophobetes bacterium]
MWQETAAHKTPERSEKPKYYCLDMFPYPSGSGLHVGHLRGYVLSDVWARYKKLQGYNVLHPMGWDSFGLPAENDAIKRGIHPRINTEKNIQNMKRQLEKIDAMYDWSREINTSSPEYYKWTQWIFLKIYKKGLAYRKMVPINWCPSCKTGLANEEVVNGRCERCESPVTKKNLMQWMLRITRYADRLLQDLDKLDWPEKVKTMQTNWIGYSEGAEVVFKALSARNKEESDIPVFTTRPDTLFGATYMVLAPEHELVEKITSPHQEKEVQDYVRQSERVPEVERLSEVKQKTGVFTGAYAINPVNGEKTPVWISDYVLLAYGTGAIMAVPAHDRRDFEFATKFDLPIREVIYSQEAERKKGGSLKEAYLEEGKLINSGAFNGLSSQEAREKITQHL